MLNGWVLYRADDTPLRLNSKTSGQRRGRNRDIVRSNCRLRERVAACEDPFWRSTTVVALLREDRVAPGEKGSFRFAVSAPKTSGQILQTFQLKTRAGEDRERIKNVCDRQRRTVSFSFRAQIVQQS